MLVFYVLSGLLFQNVTLIVVFNILSFLTWDKCPSHKSASLKGMDGLFSNQLLCNLNKVFLLPSLAESLEGDKQSLGKSKDLALHFPSISETPAPISLQLHILRGLSTDSELFFVIFLWLSGDILQGRVPSIGTLKILQNSLVLFVLTGSAWRIWWRWLPRRTWVSRLTGCNSELVSNAKGYLFKILT